MSDQKQTLLLTIYGDSLGMPRSFAGVACHQTYAELLRQAGKSFGENSEVVVFNRSQGGARINDLFGRFTQDLTYISDDKNKILIIQCGIVDCAPRPLPWSLRRLIGMLPTKLRGNIIGFLHEHRAAIQKFVSFRFTAPEQFQKVLGRWLLAAKDFKKIYIINIFPTTQAVGRHSPGLEESIKIFNRIIDQTVKNSGLDHCVLIDVFGAAEKTGNPGINFVAEDGHHLTAKGHELIKSLILEKSC